MVDPSDSEALEASKKKASEVASKLTGTNLRQRGKVGGLEDDGAKTLIIGSSAQRLNRAACFVDVAKVMTNNTWCPTCSIRCPLW
jgi:hypothetical protein